MGMGKSVRGTLGKGKGGRGMAIGQGWARVAEVRLGMGKGGRGRLGMGDQSLSLMLITL